MPQSLRCTFRGIRAGMGPVVGDARVLRCPRHDRLDRAVGCTALTAGRGDVVLAAIEGGEHRNVAPGEGQRATPARLRRADLAPPHVRRHGESASLDVDLLPPQGRDLTTSQSGITHEQNDRRPPARVGLRRREQRVELLRRVEAQGLDRLGSSLSPPSTGTRCRREITSLAAWRCACPRSSTTRTFPTPCKRSPFATSPRRTS